MSRLQSLLLRVPRAVRLTQLNDVARSFLVAFAVIAAVVAASCDKVPLTSPTGSTISLAVDRSILPVNGQATVVATVIESAGTAVHNGTVVSFLATLGRFDPAEAKTVNGRATVTYLAPSVSGTAVINAFSGGTSTTSGNSSAGGVSILVGSAAVGTGGVSINAAPSTVPQTGGTVTVTARVVDSANNPLPNVAVLFSTDQGTLSSTTATTDPNGNASTQLTTNRVTKVSAAVGTQTKDFTVNVITPPTVTIESTTTTPVVGLPVSFRVTPSTATTANPIQTVVVNFGDGNSRTLTGVTGTVGFTHTYNRADGYTVTATATDINGVQGVSSTSIVVSRAASPSITFTQTSSVTPPATTATPESFSISATSSTTGVTITSIIVRHASTGEVFYNQSGGGTFAARVNANDILTATVTDSAGNTATSQLVVQ